jgi:hypothetical protein
MRMIKTGIYRHYKGKLYQVHRVVKHSETLEDLVLYETLYDNPAGAFWVRPLAMFLEKVKLEDRVVDRFAYVGDEKGKNRV